MFWTVFIICFIACCAAGSTGMLFPTGQWYKELKKPSWTPPNWLFPIAWSILYVLMAWAAARAAIEPQSQIALAFWALQIAFNTLWTPVFFGLHRLRAGMIVMVGLWLSVLATTVSLWGVHWQAGLLFVPYLIWVSYAAALNFSLLRLNGAKAQ